MDSQEEMDRFLEKLNLPRPNQEETEINEQPNYKHWNWIWSKISQKTKAKNQMASQENCIKHLEKN